jgi:hypothetical protein
MAGQLHPAYARIHYDPCMETVPPNPLRAIMFGTERPWGTQIVHGDSTTPGVAALTRTARIDAASGNYCCHTRVHLPLDPRPEVKDVLVTTACGNNILGAGRAGTGGELFRDRLTEKAGLARWPGMPRQPSEAMLKELRSMTAGLRSAYPNARIAVASIHPLYGGHGWVNAFTAKYNPLARKAVESAGGCWVDVHAAWDVGPGDETPLRFRVQGDEIHFDLEGSRAVLSGLKRQCGIELR